MTAATQFIEDAVAGGFKLTNLMFNGQILYSSPLSSKPIVGLSDLVLDPRVWKAVAKTRKWEKKMLRPYPAAIDDMPIFADEFVGDEWVIPGWHYYMLEFVDMLAEGKTVEEAFSLL